MIKESKIMKEIHKIREEFHQQTKGKDPEYILKLIKEGSDKVKQELENIKSDPKLIPARKYRTPRLHSTEEIHHIRERRKRYGR